MEHETRLPSRDEGYSFLRRMERKIAVNDCTMLTNLTRALQRNGRALSAGLRYGTVIVWNEDQPDKPYEGREHNSSIDFIKWNEEYGWMDCHGNSRFLTAGEDGVCHLKISTNFTRK